MRRLSRFGLGVALAGAMLTIQSARARAKAQDWPVLERIVETRSLQSLLDNYIAAFQEAGLIDLLQVQWLERGNWISELP